MTNKIKNLVKEIKDYLIQHYRTGIKSVILYGSYARGDSTENSDVDVMIVISDDLNPMEVEKRLSDFLFELLLKENELISVIAIPESIFENYRSPFILNTKEEGVVV